MSVYVDASIWSYGRMTMCHMLADSTEELLAMADAIGVTHPRRLQKPGTPEEHVDVCKSKRAIAVRLGAIECDRRQFVGVIRRKRAAAQAPA